MGSIDDVGAGAIGVDTAAFIYLIEENPRFLPVVLPLFRAAAEGERELVTSALTLLEVLVVPYRAGDARLAERYEALLTRSRGIRIVELTREQLRAAAQLCAIGGFKTPDALQVVAALSCACKTFVTNDRRLPPIPDLRVVQLSSYT
ncbi:MAG TPA: PIN domain-containing protein [Thermoanaerobaculia bacterium]|nr:PIN domain-containing protein [Thermoanaerobaculia bacterium]